MSLVLMTGKEVSKEVSKEGTDGIIVGSTAQHGVKYQQLRRHSYKHFAKKVRKVKSIQSRGRCLFVCRKSDQSEQ